MSFNRKKIMEVEREGVVNFPDGSTLKFVFFPNKYTPNMSDEIDTARAKDKSKELLGAWLLPLIKSWDVIDEVPKVDASGNEILGPDGKPDMIEVPVPFDEDAIGTTSLNALNAMLDAVIAGMKVGEASGTPSKGSFV